jgi:hypothetical protein
MLTIAADAFRDNKPVRWRRLGHCPHPLALVSISYSVFVAVKNSWPNHRARLRNSCALLRLTASTVPSLSSAIKLPPS